MQELDKAAMGKRIRQIRLDAGLRQWELARMLGTTQSAVHKYEHGVVPEPKRLIELARIGNTTIEWILTGAHWENGSSEQERLSAELLQTAQLLSEIRDKRESVDEALRIVREVVTALDGSEMSGGDPLTLERSLRDHAPETLELLESAWRIQKAVLSRVMSDAGGRLGSSPLVREEST